MSVDITTLGCVMNNTTSGVMASNKTNIQSAVNNYDDLYVPSGTLHCGAGQVITIDNPDLVISGPGTLKVRVRVKRILEYHVNIEGDLHVLPDGDITDAVFSDFSMSGGYYSAYAEGFLRVGRTAIAQGAVFDNISWDIGSAWESTRVVDICADGLTLENCALVDHGMDDTYAYEQTRSAIIIAGSDNIIRYNTFHMRALHNALLWTPVVYDGIMVPSSRRNKIYGNTIYGGTEERIVWDGFAGAQTFHNGYVTDIDGDEVTVNITGTASTANDLTTWVDCDLVVINGNKAGTNWPILGRAGNVFTLASVPAGLQVGDFINISSNFTDNEIYENIIVPGSSFQKGPAIQLAFGAFKNDIHDNDIQLNTATFQGGPTMQWPMPVHALYDASLVYSTALDINDVALSNTRYSMNAHNKWHDNTITGSVCAAPARSSVIFVYQGDLTDYFLSSLPSGMPRMYGTHNKFYRNVSSLTNPYGGTAFSVISAQRNLMWFNNTLPAEGAPETLPQPADNSDYDRAFIDASPNQFDIPDKVGVEINTVIESDPISITGYDLTLISVSGGEYSINGGAYTDVEGFVFSGDTVRVRHTSADNIYDVVTTTLTIGDVNSTFTSRGTLWNSLFIKQYSGNAWEDSFAFEYNGADWDDPPVLKYYHNGAWQPA